jgi:general secretion pathway protein E
MTMTQTDDAPSLCELTDILLRTGQCDARVLERGRRVAEDTGQRLDTVLLQLGLVSERGLAEAYASLLDLPVIDAGRYPQDQPLFADRLTARFLRNARALPVALEQGAGGGTLVLAMVDPLDTFSPSAIAAATGLNVRLEVAVPIELDAALNRLYPEKGTAPADDVTAVGDAS